MVTLVVLVFVFVFMVSTAVSVSSGGFFVVSSGLVPNGFFLINCAAPKAVFAALNLAPDPSPKKLMPRTWPETSISSKLLGTHTTGFRV